MSDRELMLRAWALMAWTGATDQEKGIVRFGMIPVTLLTRYPAGVVGDGPEASYEFTSREIAVSLFRLADEVGGGMLV